MNSSCSSTITTDTDKEEEEEERREIKSRVNVHGGAAQKTMKIIVHKQHANGITFNVKRDVPLGKLMFEYCHSMGVEYKTFYFSYRGKQVRDFDTPNSLYMKHDQDRIDYWCHVDGA